MLSFYQKLCLFFLATNVLLAQVPQGKKVVSLLHIYDIKTGQYKTLVKENRHFEAPNWSPDGTFLLINSSGTLEKINVSNGKSTPLNTSPVERCNNDHGYSFDGKTLFISSGKKEIEQHTSFIYKVSAEGGTPVQITPKTPSYWHGVSPDGQYIVYCAERNGNYDIYKMESTGGEEIRLTTEMELDDGPEYDPKGDFIYFNSFRTQKMEIWRMQSNGKYPEQLTNDSYSNWFPHIAPDNSKFVMISYIEDQIQAHPFGRQVKLRMYDLLTKEIKDLTPSFYGGQGTINVNSWHPDGTRFAFVSYELVDDYE
jgi:TolB protein